MPSETNAIERIAQGDRTAFAGLYERCAPGVYAYLRSRGLDEAGAADALQDTFLAAWGAAASFRGGARPLTWLIGIARHKLADSVRQRERTRAAPPEQFEGACDPMASQAERLTLQAAVDTLDPDARELLHLVFVQGLNYSEAAQVLGIPEGTIKSRMYSIRRTLATQMKEAD